VRRDGIEWEIYALTASALCLIRGGGVLLAVGLMILLAALGVAIGISAVNPSQTEASTFGTGIAIWSGLSLLGALFLGGYASTKLSAATDATTGFFNLAQDVRQARDNPAQAAADVRRAVSAYR
jgi:hypothetical protein